MTESEWPNATEDCQFRETNVIAGDMSKSNEITTNEVGWPQSVCVCVRVCVCVCV